jgi:hypothetical protein
MASEASRGFRRPLLTAELQKEKQINLFRFLWGLASGKGTPTEITSDFSLMEKGLLTYERRFLSVCEPIHDDGDARNLFFASPTDLVSCVIQEKEKPPTITGALAGDGRSRNGFAIASAEDETPQCGSRKSANRPVANSIPHRFRPSR